MSSPSLRDRVNGFLTFIWDGEEKKFLGRGGRNWAEIGAFYLVFYTILLGFFVGMLAVFYQTIDGDRPRLTGESSLLKGNPGMGFKPMPDIESTLLRYSFQNESGFSSCERNHDTYAKATADGVAVNCSETNGEKTEEQACAVDYKKLTEQCNEENYFGFGTEGKPCVLLRLNKIFDWIPEPFTEEDVNATDMSDDLKQKVRQKPNNVWIECVGENPADIDNLGADIEYFPEQSFASYYYPYLNQKGYLSPLMFVKFNSVERNVAVMVECRAWAKNIRYDRTEKEGGVHFELLLDP
ncbi:hypothetical protein C0Q70_20952 [Pomacea canaliculata]|uniref:Sodium/potassium-transporting ATPase subunit beta n=1 Tax=Pomacea canaliculata TaxID=400727 RepID=A0A2T7NB59_POMCA|nr:hypothetical protein C0Q70_20952 [Pomacea canaliculata]